MSLALKVLVALLAGLAVGLGLSVAGGDPLHWTVALLEPVGQLWVAGLRMTVVPLVVSALIVGVGGAPDPKSVGRVGAQAMAWFVALLCVAALLSVLIAPPIIGRIPVSADAAAAMRASAAGAADAAVAGAKQLPGLGQWIVDLVPLNPVKAAADGAMLPLIVFSLAFGVALTQIAPDRRAMLLSVFEGVQDTALMLVRGVLFLAPIGVFALAVALAAKLGLAAAGALATYVAVVCGMTVLYAALVLYPIAVVFGKTSLAKFARGAFPPQAVAFSTRSSLAALPAMLETARDRLGIPAALAAFLLPLAVTTFRCGAAIGQVVGAVFAAKLYGVVLGPGALAAIAVTSVATTFSVPGIPGGSIIMMVPVLLSAGIPAEGVGLLLAVDTIPDMFRTTANVTGDVVVATVMAARAPQQSALRDGTHRRTVSGRQMAVTDTADD
ncbi:MAG: dicarboxylate/amino acid:cation symporter [Gemmatimonadetes bacterium]|nr:dicarboxylate/amino acid:cation symporter [Gemmatimonadota bacterium]